LPGETPSAWASRLKPVEWNRIAALADNQMSDESWPEQARVSLVADTSIAYRYKSAKLLFDDGDHAGALTRFKRAYDVSKDVALLWNIGVCEKELNHCAGSARVVSRYLKEGGQR
jgi:hypothetical protein